MALVHHFRVAMGTQSPSISPCTAFLSSSNVQDVVAAEVSHSSVAACYHVCLHSSLICSLFSFVQALAPPPPPSNRPKSWDMGFGDVEDDYDPFRPNDYMEYCKERIDRKKQEERDRELKIIMEEQEREVSFFNALRAGGVGGAGEGG